MGRSGLQPKPIKGAGAALPGRGRAVGPLMGPRFAWDGSVGMGSPVLSVGECGVGRNNAHTAWHCLHMGG